MRKGKEKTGTRITRTTTLAAGLLLLMLLPMLSSCVYDTYEEEGNGKQRTATGATVGVEMTLLAQSISDITSTSETYVEGTTWENYIDINGGDYRIYFFTYNPNNSSDALTNNTLIAEFTPTDIFSTDLGTYTTYTLSSEIDKSLISSLTNFKVVVIANWGIANYPEVTPGTTNIDDICNAGTFSAFVDGSGNATLPSESLRIPFYGVHEYSGVTWKSGWQTNLGTITLLRAVAKVEVILENSDVTFTEMSINNYNAMGYCAPSGVYLKGDYDHDYIWAEDFVDGLHLVSKDSSGIGINDPDQTEHIISMYKTINSDGYETWVAYLTEYDNSDTDYCYITAKFDYQTSTEAANKIYFANYSDGVTTATSDYDIYRNYLYRFHVTLAGTILQVHVDKWENTYENDFTFTEDDTYTDSEGDDSGGNTVMNRIE